MLNMPVNYRETPFLIPSGQTVWVAALAIPDYGNQDPKAVMAYLKKQDVHTIIGLEAAPIFLTIADELELNYINESIRDFTAPSLAVYDQIYDEMLALAEAGKKIAIHCFGGIGRTGTVLAAIKLRELAMSEAFYDSTNLDERVDCYPVKSCSINVRDAVFAIRNIPGNEHAVEATKQIESLCAYETLLRKRKILSNAEEKPLDEFSLLIKR